MDKLKGLESLQVVNKRFSDGCEVVQCILEFYKEIADVEHSYASRMYRLVGSSNYTFHSNILMQWLGGDPYEERGTVKCSWQKMGAELTKLATLHAEKAESFADTVRKPLQSILPGLEEKRKQIRLRKQEMEQKRKSIQKKYERAKDNYHRIANGMDKTKRFKMEDLYSAERGYVQCHGELVELMKTQNEEISRLMKDISQQELMRVNTICASLQEFAKTLSNTAPAYLESMQRIVMSLDEIDGPSDIESFVNDNVKLMDEPIMPALELHGTTSHVRSSSSPVPPSDLSIDTQPTDTTIQPLVTTPIIPPPSIAAPSTKARSTTTPTYSTTPITVATPTSTTSQESYSYTSKPVAAPTPSDTPTPSTTPTLSDTPTNNPSQVVSRPKAKTKPVLGVAKSSLVTTVVKNNPQVGGAMGGAVGGVTLRAPSMTQSMTSSNDDSQTSLYNQLSTKVRRNDYYSLFGVSETASLEEISKARRELTGKLHPDHFKNDPVRQEKADERLKIINEAYTNIFKTKENRELYDQLVRYRKKYDRILEQEGESLKIAKTKLLSLNSSMKKGRLPLSLQDEIQIAIRLIEDKMNK